MADRHRRRLDRAGLDVERWLRHWLDTRTNLRATTPFHYTRDVEQVLIPHLGGYPLADLDAGQLRTVFAKIVGSPTARQTAAGVGDASPAHHFARRSTSPSKKACWPDSLRPATALHRMVIPDVDGPSYAHGS